MRRSPLPRPRGGRLLLLPLAGALLSCTLDSFLFEPVRQEGPYDFSATTIPADKFTVEGDFVAAADGTRIQLHHVLPADAATARGRTSVFFCHGNSDNLFFDWPEVEGFYDLGYRVLIFDYRGFGRSEGSPTEAGLYQDAEAALAFLLAQPDVDPARVAFVGDSLGAAVCTELAYRHADQPAALVLAEPFRSIQDLVADGAGVSLPVGFVTNHRFDNYAKIDAVGAPLLVLHGDADTFLMPAYGRELYDKALEPKEFHLVPGADHGEVWQPDHLGFMLTTIGAFLDAYVP
jgi:hypothetical protein